MKRDANSVLRLHAIERMRQRSIPSRDMEQTLTFVRDECEPRMSSEAWVTSCLLTKGVDERLWPVLTILYCGWERATVEVSPHPRWSSGPGHSGAREWVEAGMPKPEQCVVERIAGAVTLQVAAAMCGMSYAVVRRMRGAALMVVAENLAKRGDE